MNKRTLVGTTVLCLLVLSTFVLGALHADKERVQLTLGGLFKPTACLVESATSTLTVTAEGRGATIVCGRLAKLAHDSLEGVWINEPGSPKQKTDVTVVNCAVEAHGVTLEVRDKPDSVYGQITCVVLRGQGWLSIAEHE